MRSPSHDALERIERYIRAIRDLCVLSDNICYGNGRDHGKTSKLFLANDCLDGLVIKMLGCGPRGPGSNPGRGILYLYIYY